MNQLDDYYYPDLGCSHAKIKGYKGGCLECPYPECLLVIDSRTNRKSRNEEILEMFNNGATKTDIAMAYNLTAPGVSYILKTMDKVKVGV